LPLGLFGSHLADESLQVVSLGAATLASVEIGAYEGFLVRA